MQEICHDYECQMTLGRGADGRDATYLHMMEDQIDMHQMKEVPVRKQ